MASSNFALSRSRIGFDFSTLQRPAIGAIIGRAGEPGSELATHRWLRDHSGLEELIGYDFATIKLYEMYRIADRLLARKAALEEYSALGVASRPG
ncbi:MAG: hypothetical protein N839_0008085 [Desulfofustis sp. PB-SRB1]|jgi:hypothetical protein|nr:hypothetical protein [Desulfofustis sp. PB-SRB1]MBM1002359.1 hypothetical protein [Desulfofustis sp. PB-SRB1]HBH30280.1 hypothetical protein [Desulfofustis sp.]HBH31264.1 hypothetical protein [Desulfofustis sp.]